MTGPGWLRQLETLLTGGEAGLDAGAELLVTDPNGTVALHEPLARHYRLDDDEEQLLWIRPIIGGYTPDEPGVGVPRAYSLNAARPRALAFRHVDVDPQGRVRLQLAGGQTATVQPASGPRLAELQDWDTFVLTALTADEETALDALWGDSWYGRWA